MKNHLLILLLFFAASIQAQVPTNNNCSGAITINPDDLSCPLVTGNLQNATQQIAPITCGPKTSTEAKDVWYKFTANSSSQQIIVVPSSGLDVVVDIRSGGCTGSNITCSDGGGLGGIEVANYSSFNNGAIYYIRVYAYGTSNTSFAFDIYVVSSPSILNDNCGANAITLTPQITCNYTQASLGAATQSTTPILCNGYTSQTARDVWFKFTAATIGQYNINVTIPTCTLYNGFDAVVSLYSSCGSTPLTCADAGGRGQAEILNYNITTTGTYYIRVYDFGQILPSIPTFNICVTTSPTCIAPSTQASYIFFTGVGSNSLTVNWSNGNGSRRVVKMRNSSNITPPANFTNPIANSQYSGAGQQVIYNGNSGNSVTVTGLSPNTQYWFAVYEANCSGSNSVYNTTTVSYNQGSQTTYNSFTVEFYNIIQGNSDFNEKFLGAVVSNVSNPSPIKICADGSKATTLVMYCNNNSSYDMSDIRFRIKYSPIDINYFGTFDDADYFGNSLQAKTRFTHPNYLPANSIGLLQPSRDDVIEAYDINDYQVTLLTIPIEIYRAPLVFIHGIQLTENPANTFNKMEDYLIQENMYPEDGSLTYKMIYNSHDGYDVNYWVTRAAIDNTFKKIRENNFSAGKADVITHSMGGVLTRLYLQNRFNIGYKNDLHKFIALNCPNSGTKLASFLYDGSYVGCLVTNFVNNTIVCSDGLKDLRINSYATDHILNDPTALSLQNKVPTHLITSDFSVASISSNPVVQSFIKAVLGQTIIGNIFNKYESLVFDDEPNDIAVPLSSEEGGIYGNSVSYHPFIFHIGSPDKLAYKTEVSDLLNANPTSSLFTMSGFNPPNLSSPVPPLSYYSPTKLINDSVHINIPSNGQTFSQGSPMSISVAGSTGVKKIMTAIGNQSTPLDAQDTLSNNQAYTYQIPNDAIGEIRIISIGSDSSGFLDLDTIKINVVPTATLDSINISPTHVYLPAYQKTYLSVTGFYNDAIVRDLSYMNGIQYNFTDTSIAKRNSLNEIEGKNIGITNLTLSYQGKSASTVVEISDGTDYSIASFGCSTNNVCKGSTVNFTNQSSGNPISFKWQFPGGNPSTSTSPNPIVTYNNDGIYGVTLIATYPTKTDTLTLPNYITVTPFPTATITAQGPTTICTGDSVMLVANTEEGLAYQWKKGTTIISGATSPTYIAKTGGTYKVSVTNSCGFTKTSTGIIVTVNTKPTATITASGSTSFCEGDTVILNANTGTGLTYQWLKDRINIIGATTTSYIATSSGEYNVIVSKSNGCNKTSNAIAISTYGEMDIEWQKCLGGTGNDLANSMQQTSDGGYIVAGYTWSNDGDVAGNHGGMFNTIDYWIVKLDAIGIIQWQKCLGGSDGDLANSIQQTSDGGYIVAGYTASDDGDVTGIHDGEDYWIVKLDSIGTIQWQKCLGGTDDEQANSIQQTSDGGYIVAGMSRSNDGDVTGNHGYYDYWVVKLNDTGIIEWQKSFGGSAYYDEAYSIRQTLDGGYIVAGFTQSWDGDVSGHIGGDDYWVVKLDNVGIIQWQKCLGGSSDEIAYSIQQTSDSGYIVAGWTASNNGYVSGNHGYSDYWIVKLNVSGLIQWQKCLGGGYEDYANAVHQTSDGGYIVAGYTQSTDGNITENHGSIDYWVIKLDTTGIILWQKCFGGYNYDYATSIQQTLDKGYIVSGSTYSSDGDVSGRHGSYDYWIAKLNASNICPSPSSGLKTTNITASSAKVKWNVRSCAVGYSVQYRVNGTTTWTIKSISTNTGFKSLTGLNANTTYQWRVKSKCADNVYSAYSSIQTFTTAALRLGNEEIENEITNLSLYPNPTTGTFNMKFNSEINSKGELKIFNTLGKEIFFKEISIDEGENSKEINLDNAATGIYFVNLKTPNETLRQKIVKE